jgi:hypothetical protein
MTPHTPLLNANQRPSGETAGVASLPNAGGGIVSLCFSCVSTDTKNNPQGPPGEQRSAVTSAWPSGNQARSDTGQTEGTSHIEMSVSFCSGPPVSGMRRRVAFGLSLGLCLRNAMYRPSGDHAGLKSTPGCVVRRLGGPGTPIIFTYRPCMSRASDV